MLRFSMIKIEMQKIGWIVVSILLFLFFSVFQVRAKELSIAFPVNIPPWTIQKNNSGITIDILQKAFMLKGYTVKIKYLSLKELNQSIGNNVDAHAQVESRSIKGYYSKQIAHFHTSLISLAPKRISLSTIHDLKNKHIVAFQNASLLFGKDFQKMTQSNSGYKEMANQESQIVQLYNGQTDVILLDRQIFLYFRRITSLTNTSMSVKYHNLKYLTHKSPTFVVFRNVKIRDTFNTALKKLRKNGEYYNIFYKYVR
jgi:polar amino acid transport system substrate-binding protein